MAGIRLTNVTKRYGPLAVVRDVSLEVGDGEFMALLGPSGCGKTTLLRLIAGLERPDGGEIGIAGEPMAGPGRFVPPEHRELGMVFQSYALWPNMSVSENVGFGLRVRRIPGPERRRRVAEALETVGLVGFEDRRPQALSGGQRQRTALARCLALRPRLILLDEPLANLDAHLRREMQNEFRRIHREAGTTFIFVTHDQREAMALADRIAVMDAGQLQQVGTPEELYASPATPMVAGFLGGGCLLPVTVGRRLGEGTVEIDLVGTRLQARGGAPPGPGWLCLRPESIAILPEGETADLTARVDGAVFQGGDYALELRLPGLDGIRLEARAPSAHERGAPVGIRIAAGGWVLPGGRAAA